MAKAKKKPVKKVTKKKAKILTVVSTTPETEQMKVVAVPDPELVRTYTDTEKAQMEAIAQLVTETPVENDERYKGMAKALYGVACHTDIIDNKRKEWGKPLKTELDALNAAMMPVVKLGNEAIETAKSKLANYAAQQTLQGKELPKLDTARVKTEWSFEVEDVAQVPVQYLIQVPNHDLIAATVQSADGKIFIPGIKPVLTASVQTDRK